MAQSSLVLLRRRPTLTAAAAAATAAARRNVKQAKTTTTANAGSDASSNNATPTPSVAAGYWTLAAPVLGAELVVKKSRFVASAWPVASAAQAQALIAAASDPGASHNCWAFRIGDASRSADDGEPGGTAGRPILGAIEGDGLDGVSVLVVRFFGGTKLGAGPLARAYAQATRDAMRAAPKEFVRATARATVDALAQDVGLVYAALQRLGAEVVGEPSFGEGGGEAGRMRLDVTFAADRARALADAMAEATAGRARVLVAAEGGGGGG